MARISISDWNDEDMEDKSISKSSKVVEPTKAYEYDEFVGKSESIEEIQESVRNGSAQVEDMILALIGDSTKSLDDYVDWVRSVFLSDRELTNQELDSIIIRLSCLMYPLIWVQQRIDVHKGVASEEATYHENANLITATGTVAVKQATASNATIKNRVVQLAYKNASATVQAKINGAKEILASAKLIQKRRLEEMRLTGLVTSAE